MKPILILSALAMLASAASAHSWNYNPVPRDFYNVRFGDIDNSAVPDGCQYTREEGHALTYSKGGDLSMRSVSRGKELCVSWMANGHPLEQLRGYVRISLSSGSDTQEEFDNNILLANVDFAAFEGVRVLIPEDTPLGLATLKFYWDYCGSGLKFGTCSDIMILETDDPAGQNYGLRGNEQERYLGNCVAHKPPVPPPGSFSPNNCQLIPLPEGGDDDSTGGDDTGDDGGHETEVVDTDVEDETEVEDETDVEDEEEITDCTLEYRTTLSTVSDNIAVSVPLDVSSNCLVNSNVCLAYDDLSCQLVVTTKLSHSSHGEFMEHTTTKIVCSNDENCDPACVNGICVEGHHHFCECDSGWAGSACDIPVCSPSCQNNGVCMPGNTCDCTGTGHTGAVCETPEVVSCDLDCGDHGTCNSDGIGGPVCDCEPGWSGTLCDTTDPPSIDPPLGRCLSDCDCWGTGNYCKDWQNMEGGYWHCQSVPSGLKPAGCATSPEPFF